MGGSPTALNDPSGLRAWDALFAETTWADVLQSPLQLGGEVISLFASPGQADEIRSATTPLSGSFLDTPVTLHGTLDILGMVPAIGNIADGVNGLLYLAEGNKLDAALSFGAMIPAAGQAIAGARMARNGARALDATRAVTRGSNGIDAVASVSRAGFDDVAGFARPGREIFASGIDDVAVGARRADVPGSASAAPSTRAGSCPNSFVPGTLVLMADGSLVAIEDIELGDEVWATDPETGEEGPRSVEALIEGEGEKVLVAITTADGGVFVATDGHPIWEVTEGEWLAAAHLGEGDVLLGEDGPVTVTGVEVSVLEATVHNLTVEDIHTFSVSNGFDEILTHNTNCPFVDLSNVRSDLGLPAAGSVGDKATLARLDVGEQTFYGINAPGVVHDRPAGVTFQSLVHAEGDALATAAHGQVRGGAAILYVDRAPCPFCRNSFAGFARELDLDSLTVVTPNGVFGTFTRAADRFVDAT